MKPTVVADEMFPEGAGTYMDLEEAGGSSGLLMDLAANEKAVHADFFNDFDDLYDDDDLQSKISLFSHVLVLGASSTKIALVSSACRNKSNKENKVQLSKLKCQAQLQQEKHDSQVNTRVLNKSAISRPCNSYFQGNIATSIPPYCTRDSFILGLDGGFQLQNFGNKHQWMTWLSYKVYSHKGSGSRSEEISDSSSEKSCRDGDNGSDKEVWDDWRDNSLVPRFPSSSSTVRTDEELGPAPSSGRGSTWPVANSAT
ncbi:COP9 signalosome complex subunit 9 homolog [Gryllus bimaculatus]|nr:COP9 signalosome complex subunit 9 homolog [Gryllus bimaculatus]